MRIFEAPESYEVSMYAKENKVPNLITLEEFLFYSLGFSGV